MNIVTLLAGIGPTNLHRHTIRRTNLWLRAIIGSVGLIAGWAIEIGEQKHQRKWRKPLGDKALDSV